MDYQETLEWMFARLPMYQRQGAAAFRKDLTNIKLLDAHLQHPHKYYKTIHVAGTNGKGSTSHMLAAVLQEAGYKTGLYTSPHLKDFRERIRVDGTMVPQDYVVSFIAEHKTFIEKHSLSFFELTVGMAFDYFAKVQVDVAIIEVGLGGRLDATNIITPEISVITNIGLDHTAFLGTTLKEIAGEKAGIIKPGVPVVVGEKQDETTITFIQKAVREGSEIFFASDSDFPEYPSDLKGVYQQKNKKTVLKTLETLQGNGAFLIKPEHISEGIKNAAQRTGLQGRWQQLGSAPNVYCDTGHNKEGLVEVFKQLRQEVYDNLHIVLGVVSDKDLNTILPLFPKEAVYYFCKPNLERGLDAVILSEKAAFYSLKGEVYATVAEAYKTALKRANKEDLIFIGGSTFVVAEII
ncbi:bifunctional folylpolyglutamate synthase/dihydrofolate synthase [Flavimarina sp. Hel_I_48]|uniref:bifunctional folylpolyglutamate synthase/dihydrofolate synthase n=1 Tax=Flavimarina sp. Hel_I_48 TaxID=1392488 RepID=UPI0004DF30C0|nr:folylpolyglutamate synthase/dihydrofolate synthase family protein [Flavimarina sp. Hel_I_48]